MKKEDHRMVRRLPIEIELPEEIRESSIQETVITTTLPGLILEAGRVVAFVCPDDFHMVVEDKPWMVEPEVAHFEPIKARVKVAHKAPVYSYHDWRWLVERSDSEEYGLSNWTYRRVDIALPTPIGPVFMEKEEAQEYIKDQIEKETLAKEDLDREIFLAWFLEVY
jgi:hypothetical protein